MTSPTQGEHAQTEALRLADALENPINVVCQKTVAICLRRLHAQVAALTAAVPTLEQAKAIQRAIEVLDWLPTHDNQRPLWDKHQAALAGLRNAFAAPGQPAAPQGVAYAGLPESSVKEGSAYVAGTIFTVEDMRDFADRTHALRASHGQAPAGAERQIGVIRFDNRKHPYAILETCVDDKGDAWTDGQPIYATPTAQAAPAAGAVAGPMQIAGVARTFGYWQTHPVHEPLGDYGHVPLTTADKADGWTEVALAAAPTPAAQADSQPAPVLDYPPLPNFDSGGEPIWPAIFNWKTAIPGSDASRKANAIESAIIDQLRAYVDADRAARAQADSVLEDAARLGWIQHNGATVEVIPGNPSYDWCFRVAGLHATTRNNIREAIDAARKQGGTHD